METRLRDIKIRQIKGITDIVEVVEQGPRGIPAPHVIFQYSESNITKESYLSTLTDIINETDLELILNQIETTWHTECLNTDEYFRTSTDNGLTFSNPIKFRRSDSKDPYFSDFFIEEIPNTTEVGSSIPETLTFIWNINNIESDKDYSVSIFDKTNSKLFENNLKNNINSYTIKMDETITKEKIGSHIFTILSESIYNKQYSRDLIINWRYKIYYGELDIEQLLDETDIETLNKFKLHNSLYGIYEFDNNGYKYFAFPKDMYRSIEFIDNDTNFNIALTNPYEITYDDAFNNEITYIIYRTSNILHGKISILIR